MFCLVVQGLCSSKVTINVHDAVSSLYRQEKYVRVYKTCQVWWIHKPHNYRYTRRTLISHINTTLKPPSSLVELELPDLKLDLNVPNKQVHPSECQTDPLRLLSKPSWEL